MNHTPTKWKHGDPIGEIPQSDADRCFTVIRRIVLAFIYAIVALNLYFLFEYFI